MKCFSLEPALRRSFGRYGALTYDHRWSFFLVPPLLTALLGIGFFWFGELEIDDPAYVFTPRDARWKRELATFTRLWPLDENKFLPGKSFETKRFVHVLCKAKDGGNVLRPEILDEIELLNRFLMENLTVPTYDRKYNLSYQDLCLSYDWVCGANEHIRMFREMAQVEKVIDLTYPRGGNKDTPAYLGTAIGDIKLAKDNTVLEAKITPLFYFLKQSPATVSQYSTDFEYAAERFILRGFESKLITVSFAHYQSLQDGLDENARRFMPNFVTSLVALTFFCIGCSFTLKRHSPSLAIDWIRSKPYVACVGLITTLLSLVSAFGSMLLLNIPYNVVNTIIPFLIIAIGIDDMFIMNACWDQTDRRLPPKIRMEQTLSQGGVAVSITNITDILAFLIGCATELPGIEVFCLYAFASVLFCYIYQLTFFAGFMAIMGVAEHERRHCIFIWKRRNYLMPLASDNIQKISVICVPEQHVHQNAKGLNNHTDISRPDYSVELRTKLAQRENAVEAIDLQRFGYGHGREKSPEDHQIVHRCRCGELRAAANGTSQRITANTDATADNGGVNGQISAKAQTAIPKKMEMVHSADVNSQNITHRFFSQTIGPFILNNFVRAIIVISYLVYISLAVVGCLNFRNGNVFREGLEPSHLVTTDHYISRYFEDMKVFWKMGPQLHVAIRNPPNLTDPIQREQLMALVRSFENTSYTMGREGTVFFLLEYLNYLDALNAEPENTDRVWNRKLQTWLKYTGGSSQWEADIVRNKHTNEFEAYRFQIAMKNIVEPNQHKLAAKLLRQIADQQPFHVEIYHEAFPFADQYLIILPSTYRNVLISLAVMTIVAFLLIPSIPSAILIVLSIISICTGVFGYMTFWGVNLDAVSMISIIMSIGFAVDLSAHIVYAFVTAHGDTKERIIGALEHLGWPIFQGAASTIIGISVLYTVDAYIILTFFKTIWLTMILGLTHGLLFMPVMLSFIPLGFFQLHSSVKR